MPTLAFSSTRRSGAPTLHASLRGSGALVEMSAELRPTISGLISGLISGMVAMELRVEAETATNIETTC